MFTIGVKLKEYYPIWSPEGEIIAESLNLEDAELIISSLNGKSSVMSWRDVFNGNKIYPHGYKECRLVADSVNYKFLEYKGFVYSISDFDMKNPICKAEDLK